MLTEMEKEWGEFRQKYEREKNYGVMFALAESKRSIAELTEIIKALHSKISRQEKQIDALEIQLGAVEANLDKLKAWTMEKVSTKTADQPS